MRDDDKILCRLLGPEHYKLTRACSFCMKQSDCKNYKDYVKENGIMKKNVLPEMTKEEEKGMLEPKVNTIEEDFLPPEKAAEEIMEVIIEEKTPEIKITKGKSFLTYKFTKEELAEMSKELASKIVELREKENHKKSVVKQLDADVSRVEAEVYCLSTQVNNGWEMRDIPVEYRFDYEKYVKNMFRMDNEEFVKSIPLSMEERQLALPIEPKKEDEKVEEVKKEEDK